jgi:hypothetical protein
MRRAIASSCGESLGYRPFCAISPWMIDTVVGIGYFWSTLRSSTSPAYGEPATSDRFTKPSPSMCTNMRRRPFSVVTSGTGIVGSASARRMNSIGCTIQRSPASPGSVRNSYGEST